VGNLGRRQVREGRSRKEFKSAARHPKSKGGQHGLRARLKERLRAASKRTPVETSYYLVRKELVKGQTATEKACNLCRRKNAKSTCCKEERKGSLSMSRVKGSKMLDEE